MRAAKPVAASLATALSPAPTSSCSQCSHLKPHACIRLHPRCFDKDAVDQKAAERAGLTLDEAWSVDEVGGTYPMSVPVAPHRRL